MKTSAVRSDTPRRSYGPHQPRWPSGMKWCARICLDTNKGLSALLTAMLCFGAASPVTAESPDGPTAERVFAEAKTICARDNGALWGQSLCGPMFLIDWRNRHLIANQADAEGRLTADGNLFRGVLPENIVIANTPTEWAGVRWTQLIDELPNDEAALRVLIAHELFHRIQPSLGLARQAEAGNRHLDSLEGRYLLQLEWRALEVALRAQDSAARRTALSDAISFRLERYRLFPNAAVQEQALEVNEGIAEYTGVRLGLATAEARTAFAIRDLSAFVTAPTFVRSFAYATGPAYGLLLDDVDRDWRIKAGTGARLDVMLADGYRLADEELGNYRARIAAYDSGALRLSEESREAARQERLASYRARLVDGPVLILPLGRSNFQFNPQTLTPLDGVGMIYPTLRLTDRWGKLTVEDGGALVLDQPRQATVSARGVSARAIAGEGWTLELKPGWTIVDGPRPGDLQLACTGTCDASAGAKR